MAMEASIEADALEKLVDAIGDVDDWKREEGEEEDDADVAADGSPFMTSSK